MQWLGTCDLFFDRLLLDLLAFNWTNIHTPSSHIFSLKYFWSEVLQVDKELSSWLLSCGVENM
jgi:hypothetical protein